MRNDFHTYQTTAMTFRKEEADNVYALLGLCEEAGEVAGKVGKWRRDGTDVNKLREDVCKELGDVMWMMAAIATDFNLSLQTIADMNIEKLSSRKARNVISGQGDER